MTDRKTTAKIFLMTPHLQDNKLELVHSVSDLVDKSGLWPEIARLGMTREFIERRENFFARIIMELDFIEKAVPGSLLEVQRLKSIVATLSREETRHRPSEASTRVA